MVWTMFCFICFHLHIARGTMGIIALSYSLFTFTLLVSSRLYLHPPFSSSSSSSQVFATPDACPGPSTTHEPGQQHVVSPAWSHPSG